MLDTEAFREFKAGLNLLRDNYAGRALPHMQRAMELDRNNPYYMSYLGVVLARSEQKWGEAERLCDAAVRKNDAVDALQAGLKYARRDVRLTIAMNRLTRRREPVLSFLNRQHPVNRQLGMIRHRALQIMNKDE